MGSKREKWVAFFSGVAAVLILLEVSLRILGAFYQSRHEVDKRGTQHPVILCLGNSFTYGAGVAKEHSYPSRLQEFFDRYDKEKNITVINKGVCVANTAEILNKLNENINSTHPQIIVLQTGSPNLWNRYGYGEYLKRVKKNEAHLEKILSNLNDLFYKSRLYKLITILLFNVKKELDNYGKNAGSGEKDYYAEQSETEYREAKAVWWQLKLGFLNKTSPEVDEERLGTAIKFFKNRIAREPQNPFNYSFLGETYFFLKNSREAAYWFMEGIKANPDFRDNLAINNNYAGLILIRRFSNDAKVKKDIEDFIVDFKKRNNKDSDKLTILEFDSVLEWIDSDVREMVRIIRSKGVKLIIQNYPPVFPIVGARLESINLRLREIAFELKVPFVDNQKIFQKKFDSGDSRSLYLNDGMDGQGHCSIQGYELMATNVYDVIKKQIYKEPRKLN